MGKDGIFVSQSSQNNVLAHTVVDRLKMLGYDPFVDCCAPAAAEGAPGSAHTFSSCPFAVPVRPDHCRARRSLDP
jgi:hypothetical protein